MKVNVIKLHAGFLCFLFKMLSNMNGWKFLARALKFLILYIFSHHFDQDTTT